MKNKTIAYIIALCISIILPFIIVDDFISADKELFFYYYGTVALYILTIMFVSFKDEKSKRYAVPIFSILTLLSAIFHCVLSVLILIIGVAEYLDHSNAFFIVITLFQLGLCILAAKHISPQKVDPVKTKNDDSIEF